MSISALSKYKLCFDPAAPADGDNVGVFMRAGTDGDQISSTSVGGCEALDVNVCNDLDINTAIDGVYNGATNLDPDNAGLIAHDRSAAPGDAEQKFRSTGAKPDSDDVDPNLVSALDVNSFLMGFDGTNWDRLSATAGKLNVNAETTQATGECWSVQGCTDDDAADADKPVKIGFRAAATLSAVSDGDRANGTSDLYRRQYVNSGANVEVDNFAINADETVGGTQLSATPIASRRNMIIQNRHNKSVYLGKSGVTALTGIELPSCALAQLDVGPNIDLYALGDVAGADIRVMELG